MKAFLLIVGILLLTSCSKETSERHKTYNEGWYEWKNHNSKNQLIDSIYISVEVVDKNKKDLLMISKLQYGCMSFNLKKGINTFKIRKSSVKMRLKITSLGYLSIETSPYLHVKSDSIVANFYLAEDDRPFLNCE
ncbi:MAG: hypothetical protein JXR05_07600 [Flavobacteriaceae bacterium]